MSELRPIDPARRALLAAGAATLAHPTIAVAGVLPQRSGEWSAADSELAHRLRSRLADLRAGMETSLLLDRDEVEPEYGDVVAVRHASARMREGLAALELFKELEHLPVEAQAQPQVQRLLREVVRSIGQAIETAADWLQGWADGPGLTLDPDESHLRAALAAVRDSFGQGPLSELQRQRAEVVYGDLAEDTGPNSLRPRVRGALRRTERARRLARELAHHPSPTGLFDCTDPVIHARVRAALPEDAMGDHFGVDSNAEDGLTESEQASLRLGMFGLGVVVVGSCVLVLAGLCATLCTGSSVGLLLLLAGVGLIVLAVRGIKKRSALLSGTEVPSRYDEDLDRNYPLPKQPVDPAALRVPEVEPSSAVYPVLWVEVPAQAGWINVGIVLRQGVPLSCEAWGTIIGIRTWVAEANGDGVLAGPDAPLPGSPSRALIGRAGSRTFFIGAATVLPAELSGPLELAVNISPAQKSEVRGAFSVLLRPASSPDAGAPRGEDP